jgi:DNA-binding XRE family transcriptional regulator
MLIFFPLSENLNGHAVSSDKRKALVFPKNQKELLQLGESIKQACKRIKYSKSLVAERTGLSPLTIRKIEQGDPTVSIGHYVAILALIGFVEN